ncbi:hypothetical protein ZWY2020_031907 [Hordeum vulgare]|nr:hypothetical protein ZWY2020_031907 [Hordeum vulgare]
MPPGPSRAEDREERAAVVLAGQQPPLRACQPADMAPQWTSLPSPGSSFTKPRSPLPAPPQGSILSLVVLRVRATVKLPYSVHVGCHSPLLASCSWARQLESLHVGAAA